MEITTTETNNLSLLKPFEIQKEELQKIVDDYKNLVVNDQTFEEAKKARKVLRDKRISIEGILKENKGILNGEKKTQEDKAKALVDIISPTEDSIDAGIKAIEDRKEIEKKRKEEEQMKKINDRISSLSDYEMKYDNGSYTLGDHTITAVQFKVFSDEEFDAFKEEVKMEYNNIISLREEDAAKKHKDEERIEQQRQENEKESLRLEILCKEQEEKEHIFKSEQDRIAKELTDRDNKAKQELADQQEELRKQKEIFLSNRQSQRLKQVESLGLFNNVDADTLIYSTVEITMHDLVSLEEPEWIVLIKKITPEIEEQKKIIEQKIIDEQKKAEEGKAETERLAKLREEELRPDIEKLQELVEFYKLIPVPHLKDESSQKIAKGVIQMNEGIQIFIVMSIEHL